MSVEMILDTLLSLDRGTLPAFHAMNRALKARAEGTVGAGSQGEADSVP